MKYKEWMDVWLRNYVKMSTKRRTYEHYEDTARLHILPLIGEYEMDELSPLLLQKYVNFLLESDNKMTHKGLSPSTVNVIITIIKESLRSAALLGYKKNIDLDNLRRPQCIGKKIECFTLAEQKAIEEAVMREKNDKYFGIILCLYTGLRIGELLALTWADIDFEKGILSINKTCHDGYINGKRYRLIDTPKTKSSNRSIPIPYKLIPMMKRIYKNSITDHIIYNRGKIVFVRSYQNMFSRLLNRLNIPHKGFHALRHTFATRAIECGMDVKCLSEILGHKNPSLTLSLYTHSMFEYKSEMMNRLGDLL